MAGIGFELKKLFKKSGLAATARAYGYAGIICADDPWNRTASWNHVPVQSDGWNEI